jgi:predicted Zn-dependent protease with MMP-like domain
MEKEQFENLVAQAVEALPQEFQDRLTNIDIVVEDAPSREQLRQSHVGRGYTLLGLYQGIPLTERHSSYSMVPPDKITIFQKTIEAKYSGRDENEIKAEIGKVVRHEIAHHFGTGEARLREIEKGED